MRYGVPKYDGSGGGTRANYGRGGCIPGINGKNELFGLGIEPVTEPVETANAGFSTWGLFLLLAGLGGYVVGQMVESAKWKKYSDRERGTTPPRSTY